MQILYVTILLTFRIQKIYLINFHGHISFDNGCRCRIARNSSIIKRSSHVFVRQSIFLSLRCISDRSDLVVKWARRFYGREFCWDLLIFAVEGSHDICQGNTHLSLSRALRVGATFTYWNAKQRRRWETRSVGTLPSCRTQIGPTWRHRLKWKKPMISWSSLISTIIALNQWKTGP